MSAKGEGRATTRTRRSEDGIDGPKSHSQAEAARPALSRCTGLSYRDRDGIRAYDAAMRFSRLNDNDKTGFIFCCLRGAIRRWRGTERGRKPPLSFVGAP